jgi:hypothetical protein
VGGGERVILSGEAGVGKSRLGQEFLREIEAEGALTVRVQAYAVEREFLYQPLPVPLRRGCDLIETHALEPCPAGWMAQVARLLPDLQPEEGEVGPVAEESRGLVEGLVQFFLHLARQRPLCFFLDDLHNADSATAQFLHQLYRGGRGLPFLLLGTYREGERVESPWLETWLADVEGQTELSRLQLAPLGETQIVRLLDELCAGTLSGVPLEHLVSRLQAESEGNPFILWELLRQWNEQGILRMTRDGGCQITFERSGEAGRNAVPGEPARLPPSAAVQAMVRQRLARQGEAERAFLACAAVVGRRFTLEALERATGCHPQTALACVERLLAASLIDAPPASDAYDFRHDKIREVVYNDLMPMQRQELHRRVGAALEVVYGVAESSGFIEDPYPTWSRRRAPAPARARAEEHARELAHHFQQAAELVGPEKAAWYHYLAGSRARALGAYESAEQSLSMARSLLLEAPSHDQLPQLGLIVEQLAPVYRSRRRPEEARRLLEGYIVDCEQHNHARGLARGCVLLGLFYELNPWLQDDNTSRSLYERAVAICERRGLDDWIVYPRSRLADVLSQSTEELAQADEVIRASLPDALALGDARVLNTLFKARVRVAIARGDWGAAADAFREALHWGGLPALSVIHTLDAFEECSFRQNVRSTFTAWCDEVAASYAAAAVASPLRQWYLSPAEPGPTPAHLTVEDRFLSEARHPALLWQDATGRSRIDICSRPGWLTLMPAQDADLWPEVNLDAPRLLTPAIGTYVVETEVELGDAERVYAGFLVWQDADHFLRFEVLRLSADRTAIWFEVHAPGASGLVGRGHLDSGPIRLRLERDENGVRGFCCPHGEKWLAAGSVPFAVRETESVGLTAHSALTNAQAWFRYFRLWRSVDG